jgi:hypothetical protein
MDGCGCAYQQHIEQVTFGRWVWTQLIQIQWAKIVTKHSAEKKFCASLS